MKDADKVVDTLHEWAGVFMHRSMGMVVYVARQYGLSISQVGALFHLSHRGMSNISNIGGTIGVTSAAASQMLDRLVRQGFIIRSEDPNDRRVKQVVLTELGERFIDEVMKARQRLFQSVTEGMSSKERCSVVVGLKILLDKIRSINSDILLYNRPVGNEENVKD
jgi:DNA-binding MarR family transcriptional regulator